jgi:hypothetical protein
MDDNTKKFCLLLKKRSSENNNSLRILFDNRLYGNCISILRQELDSMIRAIYLLSIIDLNKREKLISLTLSGEKWKILNEKGKNQNITDKDMVDLSNKLNGWTLSVYKFGCAFIHLSKFHDYNTFDPFQSLPDDEKKSIINHMAYYHCAMINTNSKINDFIPYLPSVMDKISSNLNCYIKGLEKKENI